MVDRLSRATITVLPFALWACGLAPAPASLHAEEASSAASDRYAEANLRRGQLLFIQCKACHEVDEGAPHKVGPNLHGIFGRRAGTAPGFDGYSEELRRSGIVWTPETIERWLERPGHMVPGLLMAFDGVPNETDRINLVAYLLAATAASDEGAEDRGPGTVPDD